MINERIAGALAESRAANHTARSLELARMPRAAAALRRDRATAAQWSSHYERARHDGEVAAKRGELRRGVALTVVWRDEVLLLRDLLEMATDWGPFELASIVPARLMRVSNAPVYRCWFDYHGPDREFDIQKKSLVGCVRRVAEAHEQPAAR